MCLFRPPPICSIWETQRWTVPCAPSPSPFSHTASVPLCTLPSQQAGSANLPVPHTVKTDIRKPCSGTHSNVQQGFLDVFHSLRELDQVLLSSISKKTVMFQVNFPVFLWWRMQWQLGYCAQTILINWHRFCPFSLLNLLSMAPPFVFECVKCIDSLDIDYVCKIKLEWMLICKIKFLVVANICRLSSMTVMYTTKHYITWLLSSVLMIPYCQPTPSLCNAYLKPVCQVSFQPHSSELTE